MPRITIDIDDNEQVTQQKAQQQPVTCYDDPKLRPYIDGIKPHDKFKLNHIRQMPRSFYATDIDLALVSGKPTNRIVAFIDFKSAGHEDSITWSEAVAYKTFLKIAPCYIISSANPETGPFLVGSINAIDFTNEDNKPIIGLSPVRTCKDWEELSAWEQSVRDAPARTRK